MNETKTYDIIFALTIETAYLVMMMMMVQVNMSTCDMQPTDDEVAEIFKQVTL